MRALLRIAKRVANKIFGSLSDVLFWRYRHVFDEKWSEKYLSENSLSHAHRALLVEKITNYKPKTVLEVGCASGPNLFLLSKKLPNAKIKGIDISKKAIETGKKWLELQMVKNVELEEGNILDLKNMPPKSFDVVFTDAALIYVDKNDIQDVLGGIVRIAKKAVVLNEWHAENETSSYRGHWLHHYENLLNKIVPNAEIKLTKIPTEVWPGDWSKYGYLIEVKILSSTGPTKRADKKSINFLSNAQ